MTLSNLVIRVDRSLGMQGEKIKPTPLTAKGGEGEDGYSRTPHAATLCLEQGVQSSWDGSMMEQRAINWLHPTWVLAGHSLICQASPSRQPVTMVP